MFNPNKPASEMTALEVAAIKIAASITVEDKNYWERENGDRYSFVELFNMGIEDGSDIAHYSVIVAKEVLARCYVEEQTK